MLLLCCSTVLGLPVFQRLSHETSDLSVVVKHFPRYSNDQTVVPDGRIGTSTMEALGIVGTVLCILVVLISLMLWLRHRRNDARRRRLEEQCESQGEIIGQGSLGCN
jgi:flagellar biosynthesis/type III secretory pathway M-ring protein FliF/YscJ